MLPQRFSDSGQSVIPRFFELERHKAAVGFFTLPAMSGRTRNHCKAAVQLPRMHAPALYSAVMLLTFHSIQGGIVGNMRETLAEIAFKADGTRQVMQQASKLGRKAVAR